MRDVFSGRKTVRNTLIVTWQCLLNSELKIVNVPRLSEFAVAQLQSQVLNDAELRKYFPQVSDKRLINRDYLFNVMLMYIIRSIDCQH